MAFEHVIPHIYNKYKKGGTVRKKYSWGGHAANATGEAAKFGILGGVLSKNKWVGLGGALLGGLSGGFKQTDDEREEAERKANFLSVENSTAPGGSSDPSQSGVESGTAHAIDNSNAYATPPQNQNNGEIADQAQAQPQPNLRSWKSAAMKTGGHLPDQKKLNALLAELKRKKK